MPTDADFWPNDILGTEPGPVEALRKQAGFLGEKTEYVLVGDVRTDVSRGNFVHSFDLVIPSLDRYRYNLLRVSHDITYYPLEWFFGDDHGYLHSEEEFMTWLKSVLSSDATKRIIRTLLTQARS